MVYSEERWSTVSQLTSQIKKTLDFDSGLQNVWLRAEISNFKRHSRGHMYFTLKDEKSRISAVMFAGKNRHLNFQPENGMKVLIKGYVSVYEPFGQYQLYVMEMEQDGIGQLYIQYEKLKKQLEAEGLFEESRKKRLPYFPKEIAIITSPTGAAIRDMIITLKRRFPVARITLFPVLVQGKDAPFSIVSALNQAEVIGGFDVLIFGRGGGSIEELWAFNEEAVARKIASLKIPTISAVGHETDFTISDFTADLRAATPTAAAELAAPVLDDLHQQTSQMKDRLYKALQDKIYNEREKLERLKKSYAFRYPTHLFQQKEQELDRFMERLKTGLSRRKEKGEEQLNYLNKRLLQHYPSHRLKREKDRLNELHEKAEKSMERYVTERQKAFHYLLQKLNILNPLGIMDRGYSVIYNGEQKLVTSIDQVEAQEELKLYVHDGVVYANVLSTADQTFSDEAEKMLKERDKNDG